MALAVERTDVAADRFHGDADGLDDFRVDRAARASEAEVEQRQLHSELVLVCPELRRRARELMPDRDLDVLPARPGGRVSESRAAESRRPLLVRRAAEVLVYAGLRLGEVALFGLLVIGAIVVLVSLADLVLH